LYDEGSSPSPAGAILLITAGTGGIRTINEDEDRDLLPNMVAISPRPSQSIKNQKRHSNQISRQRSVEREQLTS